MTWTAATPADLAALPDQTPVRDRHGAVAVVLGGELHYPLSGPVSSSLAVEAGPFVVLGSPTLIEAIRGGDTATALPGVNRIEVIDPWGRAYATHAADAVELHLQDAGATLKVIHRGRSGPGRHTGP